MHASTVVILALSTLSSASILVRDIDYFNTLLKRQEPGTPKFACHEACGTSITLSKAGDQCENNSFLSNYAACLACAGPDNEDIWKYYGGSLTPAGKECGLSTTPSSGTTEPEEPTETPEPTPTEPAGETKPTEDSTTSVSTPVVVAPEEPTEAPEPAAPSASESTSAAPIPVSSDAPSTGSEEPVTSAAPESGAGEPVTSAAPESGAEEPASSSVPEYGSEETPAPIASVTPASSAVPEVSASSVPVALYPTGNSANSSVPTNGTVTSTTPAATSEAFEGAAAGMYSKVLTGVFVPAVVGAFMFL